jgi:hypothetical protein
MSEEGGLYDSSMYPIPIGVGGKNVSFYKMVDLIVGSGL